MDVPNAGTRGPAPAEPRGDRGRDRPGQPAARPARPPDPAGRRPVRHGDVRRHRGPGAQEADAGPVRPGQPRPAAARLLPRRLRPPRLGGRGLRADHLPVGQGVRAHAVPRDGLAAAAGGRPVRAGRVHRRRGVRPARRDRPAAGRRARHRRQLRVLPVDPAEVLPDRGRAAQAVRAVRPRPRGRRRAHAVAAGGDREAVRPGPADRQGAQRHRRRGVPRALGVPHRPLPGQGDRPEHPGAPLRQHPVRADLEPVLRGPRADHHVGGHRDRRPGRLLRRDRRRPRRHPEPPAAAAGPDRDGGAGVVRRRLAAPGEGEGAVGRPAARRPRPGHGPRPVRGRLAGRPPGASATWRKRASPPTRGPRPTPRCGCRSTPGGGRASRSTCAPASGSPGG